MLTDYDNDAMGFLEKADKVFIGSGLNTEYQ
jgi:hypothetical protein